MPKPPPLPISQKLGCRPLFGMVVMLVIGVIFGRVTAPTNDAQERVPARHIVESPTSYKAAPASTLPKLPDASPKAVSVAPSALIPANQLPPGMTGSARLTLAANQVTGKVVSIADGDTITLLTATKEQLKVRLEGIDAPENEQEYGNRSKQALSGLVYGKTITATISGKDRYGRSLAWIDVDEVSVNRKMVSDGWAWQYLQYNQDPDIAALQSEAKSSQLGLWAAPNPPMPPWEYRILGRAPPAEPPAPTPVAPTPSRVTETKTITRTASGAKYSINSNGVRHNARCRWYGNTKSGHFSDTAEGRGCGTCGG